MSRGINEYLRVMFCRVEVQMGNQPPGESLDIAMDQRERAESRQDDQCTLGCFEQCDCTNRSMQ